ncbi:ribonuclease HII [Patescibacteria group bacterium]|nr:ribonuclease HII [Patescibacteria group bacterium]
MLSSLEKNLFRNGYRAIAGIDEVGRGPLAGPVTAAIVAIRKEVKIKGVRDSKLLSAKQREEIFERVKDNPDIAWRVSHVYPKVIDRINIWQATLLAWKRSLKKLDCPPVFLFLDGNQPIPRLKMEQSPIVGGDRRIFLLSLASVIAKVSRDRLMKRMDRKYPQYGFGRHKGYGTKYHLAALKKYGPSEIHRKSFRPVFNNLALKDQVYILNQRSGIKLDLLEKEGYF